MAVNDQSLADGDGTFSDWIEIHNPTGASVDLSGYHLTDDAAELDKWAFPATSIAAGEYLVVFASAPDNGTGGVLDDYVDAGGHLHTNFGLAGNGEYLGLSYVDPATQDVTIVDQFSPEFPSQLSDVSYGVGQGGGALVEPGDDVSFLVPSDSSLGEEWTQTDFDDSAWTDGRTATPSTVVISELSVGIPDAIEIQNVSSQAVDTSEWRVALNDPVNGGLNQVAPFVWDFNDPLAAGQVLQTKESQNGLGSITWGNNGSGWAMLVDNVGGVRDFVAWGYSELEIDSLDVEIDGFAITGAELPWTGPGVSGNSESAVILRRSGGVDNDSATDFAFVATNTLGGANPELSTPFPMMPENATTWGVGYDLDQSSASGDLTNLAPGGATSQSSTDFGGIPQNAVDGDLGNWTHTAAGVDLPSWWEVDFGESFALEQVVVHNRDGCCQSRLRDLIVEVLDADQSAVFTSALLNSENILGGGQLGNGPDTLTLDLKALNSGAAVIGSRVRITRTPDPELSGSSGGGNDDEADVLSLGEVEVWGRNLSNYAAFFQTDLEEEMAGQNASVYLRTTFNVTEDPAALSQLLLNMQYDDGFVAYLNGMKIAERNAPATPQYNSAATVDRSDASALQVESIDLSTHLGLLQQGENVLAIHGLNSDAGDDDFLLVPTLLGVSTSASLRYFTEPTPSAPNGEGFVGIVGDTQFSVDRGFFDAAFQLEISATTPAAQIYYTTNGDAPSQSTGILYDAPIMIDRTTTLRAIAVKEDHISTNVDTQTYLFVDDIVQQDFQSTLAAGFPSTWGSFSADYGLDPDVIGQFDASGNPIGGDLFGGDYAAQIKDALKSLPTLSIVTETDGLFAADGIYTNATQHGVAWERPTSVEWITTDGSPEFQLDAGLRIQGGAFRSKGLSDKHSFRLLFKNIYGAGKLNFPLFGEGAVDEYNTVVLRGGANDGYAWGAARFTEQYLRDEFGRSLQRDMGSPSPHGNFAHLYINGVYWGLYNPVERPDNEFAASYISGDPDEWDAIHVGETPTGDSDAWNAMFAKTAQAGSSLTAYMELQGKNLDGTQHATAAPLLDIQSYVDYIALNVWGGNWDWPFKNFWAGRDRNPDTTEGFKFFTWDFENTIGNNRSRSPLDATTLDQNFTGSRNAGQPHTNLRSNQEYRMLFADRVHGFLFNDGALTPAKLVERYQELADQVELAMIAESARWGDMHHSTPLTPEQWREERDWILNTYLPQRSGIVLQEFKDFNLYPDVTAPSFNQHGGQVASGFNLTIAAPAETVYYTLDGSDPRLVGGAVSGAAIVYDGLPIEIEAGTTVKARALVGSEWSALNDAEFTVALPAGATNLRITELNYNPHEANIVAGLGELAVDNDSFEFVELQNISGESIDLAGVQLVEVPDGVDNEGIEFRFPQQTLAPGEFVLVVEDIAAFESRYGSGLNVAGQYAGKLANGGELITLRDAHDELIQQFEYNDSGDWPGRADGVGASLEPIDVDGNYDSADNWRSSNEFGGSPGAIGTGPVYDVVVNEVLSHSDGDLLDKVELYNATGSEVAIGGWYLSDAENDLIKFQIATDAALNGGAYLVFDEDQLGFSLDGQFGDDLWLIAADPVSGKPLRFADRVSLDATDTDVSLGRWENGDPGAGLFPMTSQTFGAANSGPVLGDLVVTEVHYNPTAVPPGEASNIDQDELEFVELFNRSGGPLDISHWKLTGIELTFPEGTTLATNEAVAVVIFDPALEPDKATAFRNVHGVAAGVRLIGPASGQLNNAGERIKILKPEDPVALATGDVLVDTVRYDEAAPWPSSPDGSGNSLQRIEASSFGPSVDSWEAAPPNPGVYSRDAVVSADFDASGIVDGADFLAWQRGFGKPAPTATAADGDADGDADVDGADLVVWHSQFGDPAAASASTQSQAIQLLPALVDFAILDTNDRLAVVVREFGADTNSRALHQQLEFTPKSGHFNIATESERPQYSSRPRTFFKDDADEQAGEFDAYFNLLGEHRWPSIADGR